MDDDFVEELPGHNLIKIAFSILENLSYLGLGHDCTLER